jgi:hypothetical protein
MATAPIKFACTSDLHYHANGACEKDPYDITIDINASGALVTLVVGDLTDGELGPKTGCLGKRKDYSAEEIAQFDSKFYNKVTNLVRLCVGNHDGDAARKFIRAKEGSDRYFFDIGPTRFVCLGLYPDSSAIKWLRDNYILSPPTIPIVGKVLKPKVPLKTAVIYYHYNTIDSQQWSDWWKPAEKEAFGAFLDTCTLPVVLIVNGHCHASYAPTLWRKKYKCAVVGGKMPAVGTIDPVTGSLVSFEFICD